MAEVNRAVTLGYDSAPEVWPLFTRTTHCKDFKPFTRVTAPEIPTPAEVGEHGEIQHATLGADSAESGQIASFAEIIKISREAIINDDLVRITTTPFEAGRAVSRLIGDKVFAVLTTNAALSDGMLLFHADHGNVGTPGSPSVTTLDELYGLFAAQTGPSGEVLNIRPRFVIAPPTDASTLAVLRAAMNPPSPGEASSGFISTLTDSRLTGTTWYALANPIVHDGIQVVLLEGDATPLRFERRQSSNDSAEFLIGTDVEVLPVDYRSMCTNAGA